MSEPSIYICSHCEAEGRGTGILPPPDWSWHGSRLLCADCDRILSFGAKRNPPPVWLGIDPATGPDEHLESVFATPIDAHTDELVWIWSGEHGCYWRPDAAGYTARASAAGVYTRAEAERLTAGCGPEKRIEIERIPTAAFASAKAAA